MRQKQPLLQELLVVLDIVTEVLAMGKPFTVKEAIDPDLHCLINEFLHQKPDYNPVEVSGDVIILVPHEEDWEFERPISFEKFIEIPFEEEDEEEFDHEYESGYLIN